MGADPVYSANNALIVFNDSFNNTYVLYRYKRTSPTFHPLYRNSVTYPNFLSCFKLCFVLFMTPSQHPDVILNKFFILVIYSIPRCPNKPVSLFFFHAHALE